MKELLEHPAMKMGGELLLHFILGTLVVVVVCIAYVMTPSTAHAREKDPQVGHPVDRATIGSLSCIISKKTPVAPADFVLRGNYPEDFSEEKIRECVKRARSSVGRMARTDELEIVSPAYGREQEVRCFIQKNLTIHFSGEIPEAVSQKVSTCLHQAEKMKEQKIRDPMWI